MSDRRLMQQALEALEWWEAEFGGNEAPEPAITALRERLAQPEQSNGWVLREGLSDDGEPLGHREPTPLTNEQADSIINGLRTCLHLDSKRMFLKTWLRDWAAHGIKE